jgi:flagellar motor switch protein FliG
MSTVRNDLRLLTGPEKAALFLMSMNEEQVSKIFSTLEEDEIREISQVMATLGVVGSDAVEKLFAEFNQHANSAGPLKGDADSTERLLTRTLGRDKGLAIMEEIRGPAGRTMWDKLSNINEEVLANYLKNEYPQTAAVVLSKVKTSQAAKVLTELPDAFAIEVINRMLIMETVQKEVLADVEKTLQTEFMNNLARTAKRDSYEVIADIFNNFDRNTETNFMNALGIINRDAAEKIKNLMFTFEDIVKINDTGIQAIIRYFAKDRLAMALKGASEDLKNLFFKNISERAGKLLREDMQTLGAVRLKEVETAQMEMVNLAKDLAGRGEISISKEKDEDEALIY